MAFVKSAIRLTLDAKTLDTLDQRAMAAGMSRSDFVAKMLVEMPKLAKALEAICDLDSSAAEIQECRIDARALLESCQTTAVDSAGGSSPK